MHARTAKYTCWVMQQLPTLASGLSGQTIHRHPTRAERPCGGSGLRNGSGLEVSISCKVISILAALRGVLACGSRQGHCGQQHQRLPGLEGVIETQVTVTKWLPFSQALRLLPAFSIDVLLAPVNSSTTVDGAIPRKNRYLVVALIFTPLFSIHKYCYVKIRNLKLVDQSHYSDHQIVLNTSWIRNTTSFLHT